jgi:hypothetical protein
MVSSITRRFLLVMMLLGLVFFLSGCRDETLIPDESMFELTVAEVEASYSVNEEITIEASLKNLSKTMFVLSHGEMFPGIGLEGETLIVNLILITEELKGQDIIVDTRTFVFEEPGTYPINVSANFEILGKEYVYSTQIEIVVE